MRETVKEYFNFTKKERTGIYVLVGIILLVSAAPAFFESRNSNYADTAALHSLRDKITLLDRPVAAGSDNQDGKSSSVSTAGEVDWATAGSSGKGDQASGESSAGETVVMSNFDPNTISVQDWVKLGVKQRTAMTIEKYRSKGGRFRSPADLLKIFGLSDSDKRRLMPFVRIAPEIKTAPANEHQTETANTFKNMRDGLPGFRRKELHMIDINTADTSAWSSLPGIGSVLSQRITKYRDKLGGFYSADQVAEVYGLQDSIFQSIRPYLQCVPAIRKISLNVATPELLEQHPYLRRQLARAIVDYRVQHGSFKQLSDLRQVVAITPALYDRMSPYLEL